MFIKQRRVEFERVLACTVGQFVEKRFDDKGVWVCPTERNQEGGYATGCLIANLPAHWNRVGNVVGALDGGIVNAIFHSPRRVSRPGTTDKTMRVAIRQVCIGIQASAQVWYARDGNIRRACHLRASRQL